jgi:hypothetical protein
MTRQSLLLVSFSVLLALPALAKKKAVPAAPPIAEAPAVDISEVKDKLQILGDGKQHYIVVDPWGEPHKHLYYGDGKRFHALRVITTSREGKTAWRRTFWEPRVDAPWKGGVGLRQGKYEAQCGERATELQPLPAEEQAKMLASATFHGPLWKHRAYALARDNKGTYYYVDRPREPDNSKAFRLFSGPRGNLKPLRMTNVVSDSQGDIFTTKKGELRLVLDKKRPVWFAGKKETELVGLPIEDNAMMIYTDLGVYAGQRLGTPCDDLM